MKNSMVDVRNHLIAQLERLGDVGANNPEELAREIERAKAISQVGTVLVQSAKVEIEYLSTIDAAVPTGFLPAREPSTVPNLKRIGRT